MGMYENWSDAELVGESLKGNKDAFSALHGRHESYLIAYGIQQMGNQYDAEVLAQETFIKAFEHLGGLQDTAKFTSWLLRIASRVGVDLH